MFAPQILLKRCFQFLFGPFYLPKETEDNANAKFWSDKQKGHYGMLWYFLKRSILLGMEYEGLISVTRKLQKLVQQGTFLTHNINIFPIFFSQMAPKFSQISSKQVKAQRKRLIAARNVDKSEKRMYVKVSAIL